MDLADHKKKKLILVGNKPPRKNGLSKEIDSFDFVLRVNRMNFLGIAGSRIDGLYLEASPVFTHQYEGGENKNKIGGAGRIFMRRHWYMHFDTWARYLTPAQYANIEVIDESSTIRETGFRRLTSSIMLLGHLLHSQWVQNYHIYITCLDVEHRARIVDNDRTWDWHKGAGEVEQEYLLNHIQSASITRLPDE